MECNYYKCQNRSYRLKGMAILVITATYFLLTTRLMPQSKGKLVKHPNVDCAQMHHTPNDQLEFQTHLRSFSHEQSNVSLSHEQSNVVDESNVVDNQMRDTLKNQLEYAPDSTIIQLLKEGLPKTARIRKLASDLDTCPHTIVTAYFKIASKFPAETYLNWMQNILSLQDCMVIFTSADMVDVMHKARSKHAASKTVVIEMSIENLPIARMGPVFWQNQLDIDVEKEIHQSYQLFWIWLSKSWCVVQAIQQNFFQSHQLFFWQDIGSYRDSSYNGKLIILHPEVVPPNSIVFMAHSIPDPPPDPIWNDKSKHFFQTGQGVGDASAWLVFHTYFAKTIELFLARNMFIGDDQCVQQSTCQLHPELCAYLYGQVQEDFWFGLRVALLLGGEYNLWRMPSFLPGGLVNHTNHTHKLR